MDYQKIGVKVKYEYYKTQEEVREHIQKCEGRHSQQVAYSSFHDAITQVCFGCKKVRTNLYKPELEEDL